MGLHLKAQGRPTEATDDAMPRDDAGRTLGQANRTMIYPEWGCIDRHMEGDATLSG